MKQFYPRLLQYTSCLLLLCSLSSCFKDNCRRTYTLYKPVYKTLTEARANMKSNAPQSLKRPGKIYVYNNYIFLNERDKGIHIIDNSIPSAPKAIAFLTIPGNLDLAVNGNTLYADAYGDLVAFDISNPKQVSAKKFLADVFPHRSWYYSYARATRNPDSIQVIVDWVTKDTTVDCAEYDYLYGRFYEAMSSDSRGNFASTSLGGRGGSMARFTMQNQHLYTVTWDKLNVFNITTPQDPVFVTNKNLGFGIETIYPFSNKLFIGSTTGMFIYDVSTPANPAKLGQFTHVRSCDPVVADDQYAYVTLRSGTACAGFTNQLEVVRISDLMNPTLQKTYPLTNPYGLSKDENLLFICDGKDGLKVYNSADVNNIKLIKQVGGLNTYDVIAGNKLAIVVAEDGLYQFNYFNENNIQLISKISISRQ